MTGGDRDVAGPGKNNDVRPRRFQVHRDRIKSRVAYVLLAGAITACAAVSTANAASKKTVTLSVMSFSWPPLEVRGQALIDAWITPFEKSHPGIKIKLVGVPFTSLDQVVSTQLGTSSAPDLLEMTPQEFYQAAANGALAKLDKLDISSFKSKLYPVNKSAIVNGHRYGLVYSVQLFGMFYNKKLLDAKGIAVPKTFPELMAAAKALTDASTGTYGFAERSTLAEQAGWLPQFMEWVIGQGAQLSDGKGHPTIDTQLMRAAVTEYMQMYDSGYMLTGATAATYRQAFAAGKIGFIFDNGLGILQSSFPTLNGLAWAAPTPFPNKNQEVSPLFEAIPAHAQHPKEAKELLTYLFDPATQARMSVALSGELPTTFDFSKPSPAYKAYMKKAYWVGPLEKAAKTGVTYIPTDRVALFLPQIATVILTELSKVEAHQETINQMLSNAQAQAEQLVS
jgi:multiple sugar transport system substrate-binding protein